MEKAGDPAWALLPSRAVGRSKEADLAHRELASLVALADGDHPIKATPHLETAKVDATN